MEKIAVLGPKGTFSDSVAKKYTLTLSNDAEIIYYPTIDHAVHAVNIGECDTGIVPIENTLDGYVQRTLDLLLESDAKICREITIPVKFSLVLMGSKLSDLKRLYVQFKASGQCRHYIDTLKAQIVTTQSNIESYDLIKQPGDGAVVPYYVAQNASGMFTVDNITDSDNNFTRFAVISKHKKWEGIDDSIKVPLYIIPQTDRPGLLSDALKIFAEHNINLVSIMSRPQRTKLGHYNFYVELEVRKTDKQHIKNALNDLKKDFSYKVLLAEY